MVKVLVVDDSLTVRKAISEILEDHPEFEVVGEARNGKEAIHMTELLRPDVISMDMIMPEMSGLAATEYIMAHFPTPILVVSASTNRGELMKTYDALAAGAVSVLEKPQNFINVEEWEAQFLQELKVVSRIPVIRHLKGSSKFPKLTDSPNSKKKFDLIAIGASTGGPKSLLEIFKRLPKDLPIPILCVLHINSQFSEALPEWFTLNSNLTAKFATTGENIFLSQSTHIFLAPGNYHMVLERSTIRLTSTELRNFCRPSVDVLFESIAQNKHLNTIGILLTGMGRDGAHGLKEIQKAGGYTMAQDEASSTIFGMPQEAIKLDAADKILPDHDIADEILKLIKYS